MSGGHFDYMQYRFNDISAEIDRLIEENDSTGKDEWRNDIGNHYPREIIGKFREAAHAVRVAAGMVQRVDYLVSGNDGEESFLRRWKDGVRKSWGKNSRD